MNNIFDVSGKVVIVTGAAQGNGKAIAEGFLDAGAKVIAVDKSEAVMDIKHEYSSVEAAICDLSQMEEIRSLIRNILYRFDRIDVLVNNAGITLSGDNPYSEDLLDKTLLINYKAVHVISSLVAPEMAKKGGGAIISITSLAAGLGFPGNPSYQASKAAVRQLTKSLACDWGKENIRANSVCPGYIRTPMTEKSYQDPQLKRERLNRMFLDRWGDPKDLIGPCIFLASEASSYITGSEIFVDGGWTSKGF